MEEKEKKKKRKQAEVPELWPEWAQCGEGGMCPATGHQSGRRVPEGLWGKSRSWVPHLPCRLLPLILLPAAWSADLFPGGAVVANINVVLSEWDPATQLLQYVVLVGSMNGPRPRKEG